MNKQIQVLSNVQIGNVILPIYGTAEEPLFKAMDVANVLGLTNVTDMVSRVDEEELTKLNLGSRQGETWFLTEDGLYEVFFQSRKPIAKQFKKQVKGILKELRLKGEVSVRQNRVTASQAKASMIIIESAKRMLRLSDSSVAALTNKVALAYELPVAIEYVDSKGALFSLTALLKRFGINISAIAFNKLLAAHGIIEKKTRVGKAGEKTFYSLTDKGLEFGENEVSPKNPKETQPMYYEKNFQMLLSSVNPDNLLFN